MIEAYLPRPDELWFRRKMLADEATMAYNGAYGGTVDFPEERWPDWYGRWVAHPEGRYYRYLRESASGKFVGEIAYHFDGEKYLADVIVYAPYRRRGYGAAGLALLCAAAKENGVGVLSMTLPRTIRPSHFSSAAVSRSNTGRTKSSW